MILIAQGNHNFGEAECGVLTEFVRLMACVLA